jgi:hypothetical protein
VAQPLAGMRILFLEYLYSLLTKISIDLGFYTIYLPFVPELLLSAVCVEEQKGQLTAKGFACRIFFGWLSVSCLGAVSAELYGRDSYEDAGSRR